MTTARLTVRMPMADSTSRRARVMSALESSTDRALMVLFVESDRCDVESANAQRGIGPKTLERWTVAVRRAIA